MQFSGKFSVLSMRVATTKTGQNLQVHLLDTSTGSRLGIFLPVGDPLGAVPQGTILKVSGDMAHNGQYLNASNIHWEEA